MSLFSRCWMGFKLTDGIKLIQVAGIQSGIWRFPEMGVPPGVPL